MYVNTSFGCRTQGQECTVGWLSALSPSRNFSTDSSVIAVPIAIPAEKFLLEAIPGRAVIERPSQRELSSTRTVAHRARGRPMRNSACMQSIQSSLTATRTGFMHDEPDRSECHSFVYHSCVCISLGPSASRITRGRVRCAAFDVFDVCTRAGCYFK